MFTVNDAISSFQFDNKGSQTPFFFLASHFLHHLSEMTSIAVHQISQPITCHSWSPDQSMIAFCPNNNEVHIYKLLEDKWEKAHVLQQHDQVVCGIDWSNKSNKIVTASHDRNSYVWNFEGSKWVPTLVVLRLNRAALCVQWSPKENKFAVGSGAKTVCICYYEQENNMWISKLIRKNHDSSVTKVSWHPNNILLATTSTDGKCRIFYTFIKGVDAKDSTMLETKFGELIVQVDLSVSWTFGVKWSPKGKTLAYTGQNSIIYFVNGIGSSSPPETQTVAYRHLPLSDVCFISENMVIGVGFDCVPLVFAKGEGDKWKFIRSIGEIRARSSSLYGSQFTDIFGRFVGRAKDEVTVETSEESEGSHDKCINCVLPLRGRGTLIKRFSTSGLDGRVIIWDLEKQEDLAEYILGPI